MLQEGLFPFPENNGRFSSNTIANMAYFVIHYWIVRAHKILDDSFCTRIAFSPAQLADLEKKEVYFVHWVYLL